jgi:hypothetical protein
VEESSLIALMEIVDAPERPEVPRDRNHSAHIEPG